MTLDQLEAFIAITEQGGLRAASKVLNKTQPSISTSIKNLEDNIGVQLFDRSGYRVQLTESGQRLYQKAQEIIQQTQEFSKLAHEFKIGKEPKIKLAIDYLCPMNFLLKLLSQFSRNCESTKIEMDFEVLYGAENNLLNDEAMIAITPFISKHAEIDYQKICSLKIVPVVAKKIYQEKGFDKKLPLSVPQIVVKDSSKSDNKANFGTQNESTKWIVSDHAIKKELIINGLGWGHLEASSIESELKLKKLIELNLKGVSTTNIPLYIARSSAKPFGPISQDLWSYVCDEFKKL